MLPPVPKIPAADAAYGAALTPAPRGQPERTAQPQAGNLALDNGSNLFAKAAIASLASEYQLSRSTAVLAETLGKLMNLPRHDGEAIQAYVVRLTDALVALPAPQRLALEQQVAKALQGLSLAMLAEILKQPTGPDAARLALLIELSRYKGMDLAAKAVTSSYQQNNSANPTPAQSSQPKAPTAQGANGESRPNANATAAGTAQPANAATSPRLVPQLFGVPAPNGGVIRNNVAAQAVQPELRAHHPAPPADAAEPLTEAATIEAKAESTSRPLPAQTVSASKEAVIPADPRSATPPATELTEMRPALPHREMIRAELKEARIAFAALDGQPAGDVEDMQTLLLAAVVDKLPPKTAGTAQQPLATPGVAPQQTEEQPTEKTGSLVTAPRPAGDETETVAHRPEAQPVPHATVDPEARMTMLEQSASQSLIAAALAKEGTPLPLVAYPPAEEEHESESPPRGSGPFSEEEAESEAEGDSSADENEAESHTVVGDETGEPEASEEAAYDDSAENYYLKMSGMV